MKNIVLLLSVLSICSCQNIMDITQDIYSNFQLGYSPVYYHPDFKGLNTPEKIDEYLDRHLTYSRDPYKPTGSPEEILKSGISDCKGYSKVFVNIMYVATGEKWGFAAVLSADKRAIEEGGGVSHCVVRNGSKLYEPQTGEQVEYTRIRYTYEFSDVLF